MKDHIIKGWLAGAFVLNLCLCINNCIEERFILAGVNAACCGFVVGCMSLVSARVERGER